MPLSEGSNASTVKLGKNEVFGHHKIDHLSQIVHYLQSLTIAIVFELIYS